MDFVAIDFETANAHLGSICQVGIVTFRAGAVVETFSSLVDPCSYFDAINVSVHGIDETTVCGAPHFKDIYPEIRNRIEDAIVVCHTAFDRVALQQASAANAIGIAACRWLDTTRVVRRTWPEYAQSGYGLANLTRDFGIEFAHHDAAEDARATGLILLRALNHSGIALEDWFQCVNLRLDGTVEGRIAREGNPDGALSGESIVFTGALSMPRREAANLAAAAGCAVEDNVTKQTTLLVVGDQDITRLVPGQSKSSKHIKAEILISKGQPIRILGETDFKRMISD